MPFATVLPSCSFRPSPPRSWARRQCDVALSTHRLGPKPAAILSAPFFTAHWSRRFGDGNPLTRFQGQGQSLVGGVMPPIPFGALFRVEKRMPTVCPVLPACRARSPFLNRAGSWRLESPHGMRGGIPSEVHDCPSPVLLLVHPLIGRRRDAASNLMAKVLGAALCQGRQRRGRAAQLPNAGTQTECRN